MENLDYNVDSQKDIEELSSLLDEKVPQHNFRVLAVHNVQATLAEKGFEIEPMKIYEVCNAGFAYRAISKSVNVAMFMPCKIVLREEGDKRVITLVRPSMISQMLPDAGLETIAGDVENQLINLINEIK